MTASDEVRAGRRFRELREKGYDTTYEAVLADLKTRDARDAGRADAPMTPAGDAVLLDTSTLSIEEAVTRAAAEVEKRLHASGAD